MAEEGEAGRQDQEDGEAEGEIFFFFGGDLGEEFFYIFNLFYLIF